MHRESDISHLKIFKHYNLCGLHPSTMIYDISYPIDLDFNYLGSNKDFCYANKHILKDYCLPLLFFIRNCLPVRLSFVWMSYIKFIFASFYQIQ